MAKKHLNRLFFRVTNSVAIGIILLFCIDFFITEDRIEVKRPVWTQSGLAISEDLIKNYLASGELYIYAEDTPLDSNSNYEELVNKEKAVLHYLDKPLISRYRDKYVVDAGDTITFLREIYMPSSHTGSISRFTRKVGHKGIIDEDQLPNVQYRLSEGYHSRGFYFDVRECATPGDYIFVPKLSYSVSLLGQSIFRKLVTIDLPTVSYTVRHPKEVNHSCMSNIKYAAYFLNQEENK